MKLPAFGKALKLERDAGRHPSRVIVIFGADWGRRPANVPCVCVSPLPWEPGTLDWRICAGVPVDVVDRDLSASVFAFAAEIARRAAPVTVHWREPDDADEDAIWPDTPGEPSCIDIANAAFAARRAMRWPPWWSESLDRDYRQRAALHFEAEMRLADERREKEATAA